MNVPIMKHQRMALAWMVNRERGSALPHGGILADDQGLGKTITTIALILTHPPDPEEAINTRKLSLGGSTAVPVPPEVPKMEEAGPSGAGWQQLDGRWGEGTGGGGGGGQGAVMSASACYCLTQVIIIKGNNPTFHSLKAELK